MLRKWDMRMWGMAMLISTWSKDPSTKVGAVIMDMKHRVVSTGFNGYARGVKDCEDEKRNAEIRNLKTIHAEINAITFANQDLSDCSIFVYPSHPCTNCAAIIIQSGISRVITAKPSVESSRWARDMKLASFMLSQASVEVIYLL